MQIRLEGDGVPRYVEAIGNRITSNVTVDEGAVIGVYLRVGDVDGEPTYRRVGEERK